MTYYYALYDDGMDDYFYIHKANTKQNALAGLRRLLRNSGYDVGMLFSSQPPRGPFRSTPKNMIGYVNERGSGYIFVERQPRRKFDNWPVYKLMADGTLVRI